MPLRIPKRHPSDTESKLTLLCCVSALESADESELWTFIAERELMEYVPMRLCLHALLDGGELTRGAGALTKRFLVSAKGRRTLELFDNRIPAHTRERIAAEAPAYRTRMVQRRQVRVSYDSAQAGEYRLRMTLNEAELPTLCIVLATDKRELAARAAGRFESRAPELLTYLYGLNGPGAVPENARITAHSAGEFTATARLTCGDAQWELSLLLPSRERAERFAAGCADAGRRLTETLCGA